MSSMLNLSYLGRYGSTLYFANVFRAAKRTAHTRQHEPVVRNFFVKDRTFK